MPDQPQQPQEPASLRGLKNWGIQADAPAQAMTDFRRNHPWIAKAGDLLSGGATDPDAQMGPVDVLGAGIPFAHLAALRGLQKINDLPVVFHGTPNVFEVFDRSKLNPHDNLGTLISATPDPRDAGGYAEGMPLWGGGRSHIPAQLREPRQPNVIPITATSQNILDIADQLPKGDDWRVLQGLLAKVADGYQNPGVLKTTPMMAQRSLRKAPAAFAGEGDQRAWLNGVKAVLNDPTLMQESGFDAVHYKESGTPYIGFAKPEQLSTPWGTPLGKVK